MSEEKTYMIAESIDEGLVRSYFFATSEDPYEFILKHWDEIQKVFRRTCFHSWEDYTKDHMKENNLDLLTEETIKYILKESRVDGDSAAGYELKLILINRD